MSFVLVNCDYIYLKCHDVEKYTSLQQCPHDPDKLERYPHDPNKNFAPAEFTKLFQKTIQIQTINLIFSDGINWKAFVTSYKKLQFQCKDEELSIINIENQDNGAFIIRLKISFGANQVEIENYIKREYENLLKAVEEKYRTQCQVNDEQLAIYRKHCADLTEIIKILANRPFNEVIAKVEQKQTLAEAAEQIQNLLKVLEQTNPAATQAEKQAFVTAAIAKRSRLADRTRIS